ncbi:MAG: PorT family protein [Muribaculaceae bacterium]|nr:PorT family protein [Muribaculaceae bacterium]
MKRDIRNISAAVMVMLAAAMATPSLRAQAHYRPHISVGVRAGTDMCRTDMTPAIRQSWLWGGMGAVTFRYTEEKIFGLAAELGLTTRGWREDFEETSLEYNRALTYITLPVMTHINFGGPRARCFVNLGPEVSFMISEKTTANFNYRDLSTVTEWPERRRQTAQLDMAVANRFDYGITGGVGGEFYLTPRNSITLEARYYFGLGNLFPSSKADVFSASRCSTIQFSVGYNFRLK